MVERLRAKLIFFSSGPETHMSAASKDLVIFLSGETSKKNQLTKESFPPSDHAPLAPSPLPFGSPKLR